jgi:hypothetical protein
MLSVEQASGASRQHSVDQGVCRPIYRIESWFVQRMHRAVWLALSVSLSVCWLLGSPALSARQSPPACVPGTEQTFTATGTYQTYPVSVDSTAVYIVADGASGGAQNGHPGGHGAHLAAEVLARGPNPLTVVVGRAGSAGHGTNAAAGGGGGSFVYDIQNFLLVAAGGGGGAGKLSSGLDARLTGTGGDGGGSAGGFGGAGGLGAEGGGDGSTCGGGGGGGFLGAGNSGACLTPAHSGHQITPPGDAAGGAGGAATGTGGSAGGSGGFGGGAGGGGGGGGGTALFGGGGGGGGYSGGGGGDYTNYGGGGGTLVADDATFFAASVLTTAGDGAVTICVAQLTQTACAADATHLCLNGGRYRVNADWQTPDGKSGSGQATALTADTGYFWFFSASSVELLLKVLNGCDLNQNYWVFAAGLTNVQVTITVTDTQTGTVNTYLNPQGTPFAPIQDTSAFSTCP